MNSKLIEEYHFLILDLMKTDARFKWNIILKEEEFDYIKAMERIKQLLFVNDNITMNRKWKIKMYKNDH